MSVLRRKLRRELWRNRGHSLAVISVTALGVLLYASSDGAYRDLRDSYAGTRVRLGLAAFHADATEVTDADLRALAAAPLVGTVDARVALELPVRLRGQNRIALRILSVPEGEQPKLDRLLLISGRLPRRGEILLERHLADRHGLGPGDGIALALPGFERHLAVSGVAVSAEYLWVARDANDVMPSPDAFGVAWMPRDALRDAAAGILAKVPGASARADVALAASPAAGNQLLVDPASPGVDPRPALRAVLGQRLLDVVPQGELVGVKLLQMDVDGYRGMAVFFPAFFLAVAAFITASVLSRIVDAQRALIGTLAALGVGRGRILGHYVAYAVALGAIGSIVGGVLGTLAGAAMARTYAAELGIPFVTAKIHWELLGFGVAIGLVAALAAALIPAVKAARLHPAEAMRPRAPGVGWATRLTRRVRAPLPVRMAMRALLAHPLRAASTAVGVAAALVLVLSTSAVMDSMDRLLDVLFHGARRYDLRVDWVSAPLDGEARRLASVDGVAAVESAVVLPVRIEFHGRSAEAQLQGLVPQGRLIRSVDLDGREVPPSSGAVVLTRALARRLGVGSGEVVRVRLLPNGPEATFVAEGLADAALGPTASANREDVARAFGLDDRVTSTAIALQSPRDAQAARAALSGRDDVARVEDLSELRSQLDVLMRLGWAIIGAMLVCSVVLASAILFNTATLSVLEKRRDLATLRAFGRTMGEIGWGLTIEHGILALLGLGLGIPFGIAAVRAVLGSFSSDLFPLPYVLSARTLAVSCVGVVAVLLFAQWPALRSVARSPVADAVRDREG